MNVETYGKLFNYERKLNEVLKELENEKNTLQKEENNSRKDKRLLSLNEKISQLEKMKVRLSTLHAYDNIISNLDDLRGDTADKKAIDANISASLRKIIENVTASYNLSEEEIRSLDETETDLKEKKKALRRDSHFDVNEGEDNDTLEDVSVVTILEGSIDSKLEAIQKFREFYRYYNQLISKLKQACKTDDKKEKRRIINDCEEILADDLDEVYNTITGKDIEEFERIYNKGEKEQVIVDIEEILEDDLDKTHNTDPKESEKVDDKEEKQVIDDIEKILEDDDLDKTHNTTKINAKELEKVEEKVDKKKEAELENQKKDNELKEWIKRNWKKITAGVVSVAMVISIIALLNKNFKKANNSQDNGKVTTSTEELNSDNLTNENNLLDSVEEITDPVILALTEKGYNEYSAKLMNDNFDNETLKSLLEYYRPEVEKYADVRDFKLPYLDDYEYTINKYEVKPEQAVDYVNRSYHIKETGFFDNDESLDVSYIIDTVKAIDHKETIIATDSLLCDALNRITENYLFGNVEENDLKKIEALPYFAKEQTDMNAFLKRFTELTENIMNEPDSNIPKNDLYEFLNVFGHSVNGMSDDEYLTDDDDLNQDASISDYYDYWIAYNYFIQPLYPLAYPTDIELPPTTPIIPEGASEKMIAEAWADLEKEWARVEKEKNLVDTESRMYELEELQVYINTVLCGPEYDNFTLANDGLIK